MPTLEQEIQQPVFRSERHKVMVNLIYTTNWAAAEHAPFFKKYDITSQQFNVLRILRGQHPKPATVLLIRERMLDKMSDVSRIVERMRQAGWIERNACPHDRRSVDIVITEKGLALLTEMDEYDKEFDTVSCHLTDDEARQLNILLDKLRG